MEKLELFDVEEQKQIAIMVTKEQYQDIVENQNLTLATTLLKMHQKQIMDKENFAAAFNMMRNSALPSSSTNAYPKFQPPPSTSLSHEIECVKTGESLLSETGENSDSTKVWSDDSVKYLIHLCKKYDKDFSSGIKKYIWNKISAELSEKYKQMYTSQQCDTKWKGLKNTYKAVKRHNEQSGNNVKFWKFYDLLDDVLFFKPEINPIATCSSARGLIVRGLNNQQNADNDNQSNEDSRSGATTQNNYESSFMRKRKSAENAVERRHQEKMCRQDKFLDLLGRLTTAIEASIVKPPNNIDHE